MAEIVAHFNYNFGFVQVVVAAITIIRFGYQLHHERRSSGSDFKLHRGGAILVPRCSAILVPGRWGAILVPRCCRDPCARRLREWCPSNLVPVPAPLAHRTPHVRAQGSAQERDSRKLPKGI